MARVTRRGLLAGTALAASTMALPIFARARSLPSDLKALAKQLKGDLLLPSDDGYEMARRVASFNPRTDQRPAMIARCADTSDVQRAVTFARDNALEIAVRGGGHDVLSRSVCDGGLLIDLGSMRATRVDPAAGRASAEAGLRAGEFSHALQTHGHAAILGCNPGVGIAGLTLGGGLGWLLGTHGVACDQLLGADIVTVDGAALTVTSSSHPDLLWALKGGGGNFGIVTRLHYRVFPLTTVVGGILLFDGAQLAPFLEFYGEYMRQAPDALTVEITVNPTMSGPMIVVYVCYSGNADRADSVLAPLRGFARPRADTIAAVSLMNVADPPAALHARYPPPAPLGPASGIHYSYWQGASSKDLGPEAASIMADNVASARGQWSLGLGHYLHGEAVRVGSEASPLPREAGTFSYFFAQGWRGAAASDASIGWVDASMASLADRATPTYINYLSDESPQAVAASYGDNMQRLRQLKRQYDPDNLLHLNRNILPVG